MFIREFISCFYRNVSLSDSSFFRWILTGKVISSGLIAPKRRRIKRGPILRCACFQRIVRIARIRIRSHIASDGIVIIVLVVRRIESLAA